MTAAQAKKLTEETLASITTGPIMDEIKQQIEVAARRGEFAVTYDLSKKLHGTPFAVSSNVKLEIVNALKRSGFNVEYYSDQRDNDDYYTIRWN